MVMVVKHDHDDTDLVIRKWVRESLRLASRDGCFELAVGPVNDSYSFPVRLPSISPNTDTDCSTMPVSTLRAPLARLSLLIRSSSTKIAVSSSISSNRKFFSSSFTPSFISRIIALRMPSAPWGVIRQQQCRGMKVRSAVKKLCDGCKVHCFTAPFPPPNKVAFAMFNPNFFQFHRNILPNRLTKPPRSLFAEMVEFTSFATKTPSISNVRASSKAIASCLGKSRQLIFESY